MKDFMPYLLYLIFVTLIFSLFACGTIPQPDIATGLKDGVIYKRDMQICLDGKCEEGVIVAPRKGYYEFKIEAHGNLDLFTFSTCHREETTERHSKKKWFRSNRKVKGTYYPSPGIEDGHCPVYIGGYDIKNRHSWAFADFEDPEYTLKAKLHCNGSYREFNGVSVCQSRVGLIQVVEFDELVTVDACGLKGSGKKFEFKIPRGECVAVIFGQKTMHRLTLIGYDKIIVRRK